LQCVTVQAELKEASPKDLEKVGVYGFVKDGVTGDSVLANNPDLSTDAGQFAMVETITPKTKMVEFEFVAAVPRDKVNMMTIKTYYLSSSYLYITGSFIKSKDISQYENGIGPLDFSSLRVISYPGGQQFGAIS